MVTKANQELTVDQAKALLGAPPLMLGESEEEYWKWWTACVEPDRPKKFLDWVEVDELAHNKWEQKRLRLFRAAIPKRALVLALELLLFRLDGNPRKVAEDYFGNDPTAQRKARENVANCNITEDQIVTEAIINRGDGMLLLDRMESNRAREAGFSERQSTGAPKPTAFSLSGPMINRSRRPWQAKSRSRPTAPMRCAAPGRRLRLANQSPAAMLTGTDCPARAARSSKLGQGQLDRTSDCGRTSE